MFPREHFHSMGITSNSVKGEDGKPTDQVNFVLRVNLTGGQNFLAGGTREEVEVAFISIAKQLDPSINFKFADDRNAELSPKGEEEEK